MSQVDRWNCQIDVPVGVLWALGRTSPVVTWSYLTCLPSAFPSSRQGALLSVTKARVRSVGINGPLERRLRPMQWKQWKEEDGISKKAHQESWTETKLRCGAESRSPVLHCIQISRGRSGPVWRNNGMACKPASLPPLTHGQAQARGQATPYYDLSCALTQIPTEGALFFSSLGVLVSEVAAAWGRDTRTSNCRPIYYGLRLHGRRYGDRRLDKLTCSHVHKGHFMSYFRFT